MTSDKIIAELEALGLSTVEGRIYLELLGHTGISPSDLSRAVGIRRPTLYLALERLRTKGLISAVVSGKRKLVAAAPSSRLRKLVAEQRAIVSKKTKILQSLIPKLEQVAKDAARDSRNGVEILSGEAGVERLIDAVIAARSDIRWIGRFGVLLRSIPEDRFYKLLTWRRMGQKTTSFAITDSTILEKPKFSEELGAFRRVKILPAGFQSDGVLIVFADTVALLSNRRGTTQIIILRDSIQAEFMRVMFSMLWESLGPD